MWAPSDAKPPVLEKILKVRSGGTRKVSFKHERNFFMNARGECEENIDLQRTGSIPCLLFRWEIDPKRKEEAEMEEKQIGQEYLAPSQPWKTLVNGVMNLEARYEHLQNHFTKNFSQLLKIPLTQIKASTEWSHHGWGVKVEKTVLIWKANSVLQSSIPAEAHCVVQQVVEKLRS